MNCDQVRAILAIYRERNNSQINSAASELEAHLAQCTACQQVLAQGHLVGKCLRSLQPVEPSVEAYTKLMQALAVEHLRFIQRTPSSVVTSPPIFLQPFLKEQTNALIAFSSADTGPLPIIQAARRPSHRRQVNHFTILAMAAAFLMIVMVGSLTSLLLLAHNGLVGVDTPYSVARLSQVSLTNYTTATPYSHVVSAVASRDAIYYTAYGDNTTGWMLERFDRQTNLSVPLLSQDHITPLIVEGSSKDWLVWLELGTLKPLPNKHSLRGEATALERTWSLHALYLRGIQSPATEQAVTLLQDTFDQSTLPHWVHSPIQGMWFINDTLLVATVDHHGDAHVLKYQLDPVKISAPTQIVSANNGHIFTSPTADSDGTNVYWSEEWFTDTTVPHSNIWTQQTIPVAPSRPGKWAPHVVTHTNVLFADGTSFHPQVVNNTLFLLSTSTIAEIGSTQPTPHTNPTITPTSTLPTDPTVPATARVDPIIEDAQPDASIQGTLLAFSPEQTQPVVMDNDGTASVPQAGARFLLWQDNTKGFQMYDVVAKSFVNVSNVVAKDATFMAVNGETAIWTVQTNTPSNDATTATPTATFSVFNWPTKIQG